ncbi:MAG: hypothetical protein NT062_38385 [Proteobacteria bacterium]|nr:hypothetical protein [Pseudomonadota bacterium]
MKRSLTLAMLVTSLAGCGGDEQGAVITLHGDVVGVTRIEIVLASPDQTLVAIPQRTTEVMFPGSSPSEPVDYYKQQSTTKAIDVTSLEGFQVRIEPDLAGATYIPFVLVFAGDTLAAIGRIGDAPMPITIPSDRIERYDVVVDPMALVDATPIVAGHAKVASCAGSVAGYAFRFATGNQRRLVIAQGDAIDATQQPFDLDCDGNAADDLVVDCDDLTDAYRAEAPEACGSAFDFNCDSHVQTRRACAFGGPNGQACTGKEACDGSTPCVADNTDEIACACVLGRCNVCVLEGVPSMVDPATLDPCLPATANLGKLCTSPTGCKLTVSGPLGWEVGFVVGGVASTQITITADTDVILGATSVQALLTQTPGQIYGPIDVTIESGQSGMPVIIDRFYRLALEAPGAFRAACDPGVVAETMKMNCDTVLPAL